MSTHFHPLLLLLSLVSTAIAVLVPQSFVNSSLSMFENHCTPRRSLFSSVPDYQDCLFAIYQLPTRPVDEEGPFHNGPPEDPYQLPVSHVHQTCQVRIELRAGGAVFKESWAGVKGAAWLLNKGCLKKASGFRQLYTGGWTTWGNDERIVITLAHSDALGDVGGNNVTFA